MLMKASKHVIRVGTCGRIVNVDGRAAAAFYEGARARVRQRVYRPDGVVVELLDEGPGWKRGTVGEVPLRYFAPGCTKPRKRR